MDKTIGGRPRHGSDVKRAPLNLRTDPELRARIEVSAEERGLSLTQEVERRLRESFEGRANDSETEQVLDRFALAIDMIQRKTERKWLEDNLTFELVQRTLESLLRQLEPQHAPPKHRLIEQEWAELSNQDAEIVAQVNAITDAMAEEDPEAAADLEELVTRHDLIARRVDELRVLREEAWSAYTKRMSFIRRLADRIIFDMNRGTNLAAETEIPPEYTEDC